MKKTLLLSAITLIGLATSTFAQSDVTVTINPATESVLDSKTATINFTFSDAVSCDSVVIIGGMPIENLPDLGQVITKLAGFTSQTSYSLTLSESYWGTPNDSLNAINISLYGAKDADGNYVANDTTLATTRIIASYTTPDATTLASFLGVDPDPYWTTAPDMFAWDMYYIFTDSVDYSNAVVTLEFYDADGDLMEDYTEIINEGIYGGYNPRSQAFMIGVPIPDLTDAMQDDEGNWTFTTMKVILTGVVAEDLTTPYAVEYEADFDSYSYAKTRTIGGEGGEVTGITGVNATKNENLKIYSIDGKLVKNKTSVSELGKGLYIINGKKVLVK